MPGGSEETAFSSPGISGTDFVFIAPGGYVELLRWLAKVRVGTLVEKKRRGIGSAPWRRLS